MYSEHTRAPSQCARIDGEANSGELEQFHAGWAQASSSRSPSSVVSTIPPALSLSWRPRSEARGTQDRIRHTVAVALRIAASGSRARIDCLLRLLASWGSSPRCRAVISASRARSAAIVAVYQGVNSVSVTSSQASASSSGDPRSSRTVSRSRATWSSPSARPRASEGFVHAHESATARSLATVVRRGEAASDRAPRP